MATKVELESAFNWCNAQRAQMQTRIANQDYFGAIDIGVVSLNSVHNSVTYQRRYLHEIAPAIAIVDNLLWYAPCFFRNQTIRQVEHFFRNGTKSEKDALPDMLRKLDVARNLSKCCVALWQKLSESPDAVAKPESTSEFDAAILQLWHSAGLVYLVPEQPRPGYAKITDFNRLATGKCFKCGAVRNATTTALAEHAACAACRSMTDFVILNRRSQG